MLLMQHRAILTNVSYGFLSALNDTEMKPKQLSKNDNRKMGKEWFCGKRGGGKFSRQTTGSMCFYRWDIHIRQHKSHSFCARLSAAFKISLLSTVRKTHQTKAHNSQCNFLNSISSASQVCHTKLYEKLHGFSPDQFSWS